MSLGSELDTYRTLYCTVLHCTALYLLLTLDCLQLQQSLMLSSMPESRDLRGIKINIENNEQSAAIFANLEDSPELLAPFVLLTDFLCDGVEWVEWWLWAAWPWDSDLQRHITIYGSCAAPPVNFNPCGDFLLSIRNITVLLCA